jgi:Glycosyltransferase family 87
MVAPGAVGGGLRRGGLASTRRRGRHRHGRRPRELLSGRAVDDEGPLDETNDSTVTWRRSFEPPLSPPVMGNGTRLVSWRLLMSGARRVRSVAPMHITLPRMHILARAAAPIVAIVVIAVLFLPLSPAYDLDVFLRAGNAVLHSAQVYPLPGTPAVYSGFSFVYPYFAVWPFVPLAAMSYGLSTAVFFVGSACAVIAACGVAADRDPWTAALVLSTSFSITGLQLGALSPLLFAGTVLLWRLRARPVSFGLVAAPVVASKLFLAPLLAWPLLARRYRAFAWTLLATIALLAMGFVVGPLSLPQYERLLSQLGAHEARAGLGLIGALRNAGLPPVWAQTAALALASTVFAGAYAHYRASKDERILFCAGIVSSLILTPVVWSHYLVLLPAAMLALDAPRRWFVVLAVASWVIAPPHGTHLQIPVPERLEASGPWLALAASLCVLAYAARCSNRRRADR